MRCTIAILFAAFLLMQITGTVNATPVYPGTYVDMYLKSNTFPSGLSEENVFLDAASGVYTLTGHLGSQTDPRLISFFSTTEPLEAANGFAQITATDGFLNDITITAPDYWFEDIVFSVQLGMTHDSPYPDLEITVDTLLGTDSFSNWFSLNDWNTNGENRILILSHAGNPLQSITINSSPIEDFVGGLDSLKQVQISGLTQMGQVSAPEPTSLMLLCTGLGVLGLAAYRRRRQ